MVFDDHYISAHFPEPAYVVLPVAAAGGAAITAFFWWWGRRKQAAVASACDEPGE